MHSKKLGILAMLLASLVLSACGGSEADATPTVSVELIQTQAVLTYQAQLTQTALANPTATPTATSSPTPEVTFSAPTAGSPVALATTPAVAGGGQSSACYGLSFVDDVTIPDGTQVTPGQSFTKTWRVSNTGTCAWESGFRFNVVSGDAMGASAVTLNQQIEPGRQYEFSVPMVAPNQAGTVTGYWQLSDASGSYFGDQVYIEVNVTGGGSAPTEPSGAGTGATATATTETATSE